MRIREFLATVLVAAGVAVVSTVAQAQQSAQAFLDSIYRPYLKKDFKGVDLGKPAAVRRYFVAPLAAAILRDRAAAAKRGEVPSLDGDPFLDAQDWDVANMNIVVNTVGASRATGTVAFTNAGTAKTVTLDLVKTGAGWRISEIKAPSGSLRELMKLK